MKKNSEEKDARPLTDLICFTAKEIMTADGEFSAVRKRVRSKVRYHQKTGNLPEGESLDAALFFHWAINLAGYAALEGIEDLPKLPVAGHAATNESHDTIQSTATVIPGDLETLKKEYELLSVAKRENEAKVAHAGALEAELNELKEKQNATTEKKRAAGKKGGRGNVL